MKQIKNYEIHFIEMQDNIMKNLYDVKILEKIIKNWTIKMLSQLDMKKLYLDESYVNYQKLHTQWFKHI